MSDFAGKRAIVTGAGSGIGAATARLLAMRGAQVLAVDVNGDALEAIVAECGSALVAHQADLAQQREAEGIVGAAIAALGGLDILINNAGIGALAQATDLAPETWRNVLAIDLDAVFYTSRMALPHLVENSGCIVNTASISGIAADYRFTAYNAAKAGVLGLTRNLAIDFAARGVRVNAVCPGYTATPLVGMMPQKVADAFIARIPMQRAGTAVEMAEAIAFLASERASYITGQALVVDGGITAHTGQPDIVAAMV